MKCETCKHWEAYEEASGVVQHSCWKVLTRIVATCGECYCRMEGDLETPADFYCAYWEDKEAKK